MQTPAKTKKGKRGPLRAWRALFYSLDGLKSAWRQEQAFVEETVILCLGIMPMALWLGESAWQKGLLIGCWLLVMIVELLNSAIEAVVDRFGEEWHLLAKQAKDMGSAAVLLALINVVLVWGAALIDRIFYA